MQILYTDRQGE